VVDPRKGLESETGEVGIHFVDVVHDPGEMGDLAEGILVTRPTDHCARAGVRVIDQPQGMSSALSGGVDVRESAPASLPPVVLDDHPDTLEEK
jgi:hypothetical protein